MKSIWFVPFVLTGLLLAGCTSAPTRVDKGAVSAHNFNFINGGIALTPPAKDKRDVAHQMIQEAITKNLAARGISRTTATQGDVIVGYMVILGNHVSTEAITTYFGYGQQADALHDKAQSGYSGYKNPNDFEAGTLMIDVVDAKTYELIYRDYVVRPVLADATAAARAEYIQEAVDAGLKKMRVAN